MQSETSSLRSKTSVNLNPIHKLRRRVRSGSTSVFNNKYCSAISNAISRGKEQNKEQSKEQSDQHSDQQSDQQSGQQSDQQSDDGRSKEKTKESERKEEEDKYCDYDDEKDETTRSNTPELLLSQKVKNTYNSSHGKSKKSIPPTDSSLSLFSEANTLVGSSGSNCDGSNDGTSRRISPPSSSSPTAGHGIDPSSVDIKSYIRDFNHSRAYELGHASHLHYYQLPFPYRENKYIIYGYRFYSSQKKSFLSIINWYGWHNETSNIWTHLLGAFYLMYLAFYDFPRSNIWLSEKVPQPAKYVVFIFLAAAIKCMFASVFWHTFNGTHVLKLRKKFACVDYTGITVLITASILTAEFVTMYDYKVSLLLYLTSSLTLGVIGVFMNWSPKFDRPEARPLRIKFFLLLAAVGSSSFVQLIFLTNWRYAASLLTPVTNKSVIWYLIGVFFYGSFIPERFRTDVLPDKSIPTEHQLSTDLNVVTRDREIHFREHPTKHPKSACCPGHERSIKSLWWVDYVGCSHTIWHFFVFLGVVGHYNAIIDMFTKRWIL